MRSIEVARDEMQVYQGRDHSQGPGQASDAWDVDVSRLADRIAGPWRAPTLTLFAAVVLVLLLACLNVATLLLARGLFADITTSGLLIVVLGLTLGCAAVVAARRLVASLVPTHYLGDPTSYLMATAVVAVAAGVATMVGAMRVARVDPVQALRDVSGS